MGELRGAKAELLAGLIWGGEGRRSEFNGEFEFAGVQVERRRRSVASGQGKSERVRGKDQGEPPGSDAHERKERRALSWPGHGGVEVATGGLTGGAWHGLERYSARG